LIRLQRRPPDRRRIEPRRLRWSRAGRAWVPTVRARTLMRTIAENLGTAADL